MPKVREVACTDPVVALGAIDRRPVANKPAGLVELERARRQNFPDRKLKFERVFKTLKGIGRGYEAM
jgi:hypothetical protein